ncbi:RrF2 family transcriptional regulator [Gottfriedia sp. NPDC056225]|uniref:RrF2 family transcriptional regulator n=1 Tax=Gottfriedia sp. NPDC056225 TaxID=3345751 RepID=UPI0035E0C7BD
MKVNKSIEQGIYVLLMLSLQINHEPVKSFTMSKILDVSDSYLKKILRKLVVAGLINSNASKDGGFTLAKSLRNVTVLEVFKALDKENIEQFNSELSRRIFEDEEHIKSSEQKLINVFQLGIDSYFSHLDSLRLSELIKEEYIDAGYYDWQAKVEYPDKQVEI